MRPIWTSPLRESLSHYLFVGSNLPSAEEKSLSSPPIHQTGLSGFVTPVRVVQAEVPGGLCPSPFPQLWVFV